MKVYTVCTGKILRISFLHPLAVALSDSISRLGIIILQSAILKNRTHSIAFCQWKFEVEDFHLKHCIDKVYTLLRTSGSN
jgi:hypothetical protein